MFLESTDYNGVIRLDILERITDGNNSNRVIAEYNAQALMETYLRTRYDVVLIFSAVGENRNRTIIRYMIDIALYDLFSRLAPEQMNELRLERHKEAMKWLKDVRDGSLSPDLPKNLDADYKPQKGSFVKSNYQPENFNF